MRAVRAVLTFIAVSYAVSLFAQAPAPQINSFSASPATIAPGGTATLTWTTSNATLVTLSFDNDTTNVNLNDSIGVNPTVTTTYTLTAINSENVMVSQARTVTVMSAEPSIQFSATPGTVNAGDGVVLTWTTTNATSVSIDNNIGSVALAGMKTIPTLNVTTTFVLTASGAGGTATASATVTVLSPLTAGVIAVPDSIRNGESAKVVWTSTGATMVTLNDGITTVNVGTVGSQTLNPAQNTKYTLSAKGANSTVTATTQVTVLTVPPPTVTFSATPPSIVAGNPVTLSWTTTNTTTLLLDNGVGTLTPVSAGSTVVNPATTSTYTLTVTGPGGTVTRSLTVEVNNAPPPEVVTLAGDGVAGSTDGGPTVARFNKPFAVAVMPRASGKSAPNTTLSYDMFVLDSNHTIRKISPDGTTATWAGRVNERGSSDGFRTNATFTFTDYSGGIIANADGSLDVTDANGLQRHIDPSGVVKTCVNCQRFTIGGGIVKLADGSSYMSDAGTHVIYRVSAAGKTTAVIGNLNVAGLRDGRGDQAEFNRPRGLTIDSAGNVYVLDTGNNAIRKITPTNVVSTMTVTGTSGGTLTLGCCTSGITPDGEGGVYVTDPGSNTVKEVGGDGSITTVAGSGSSGSNDGSGSSAAFNSPLGIATAPDGSLIVTDTNNNTVRTLKPGTAKKSNRRRAARH